MVTDALDPGADGTYPYLPRNPDGTLDIARMPIGRRHQRDKHGNVHLIDVEPTLPEGRRVTDVAPAPED